MAIHIVLVEPEIPPNTGNIAGSAAATDSILHLVKPLGFSMDEKSLRRAGLDYWPYVKLEIHEDMECFLDKYRERRMWLSTTKGSFELQHGQMSQVAGTVSPHSGHIFYFFNSLTAS